MTPRVLITTVPFGEVNPRPLELLKRAEIAYDLNPLGRRLLEADAVDLLRGYTAVIAGTEPLTDRVLEAASGLALIARVGIGLDSVDLASARRRGVQVVFTPNAPAPAVAELTVGLMLDLHRGICQADRGIRRGEWQRIMGHRLAEAVIGVIGCGRIGRRVIRHLQGGFPGTRVLANDINPDRAAPELAAVKWVDKETIYKESDIITLHLPLTAATNGLISAREIAMMKPGTLLVNTSRGNMIVESDLAEGLRTAHIGGAALDVYVEEPYRGELCALENCLLTAHMGSMTRDCRAQMELEATLEVIRFFRGEPLQSIVPDSWYEQSHDMIQVNHA